MAKFSVGEVAIGRGYIHESGYNGMECEILECEREHIVFSPFANNGAEFKIVGYRLRWATGEIRYEATNHLRKKQSPQELSSWEKIQDITKWHPNKVEA